MFGAVIKKSGRTRSTWAKDLGVGRAYLSDLLNGKKTPSLELAVRIERLTYGAVPASCWVPDTAEPRDAAHDFTPPNQEDAA